MKKTSFYIGHTEGKEFLYPDFFFFFQSQKWFLRTMNRAQDPDPRLLRIIDPDQQKLERARILLQFKLQRIIHKIDLTLIENSEANIVDKIEEQQNFYIFIAKNFCYRIINC